MIERALPPVPALSRSARRRRGVGRLPCRGLWVGRVALAEMIAEMRPNGDAELALTLRTPTEPPLPCPKCERPMAAALLQGVAVDDCATDGVLDADELGEVLRGAHEPPPAPETSPLNSLLSLFRQT